MTTVPLPTFIMGAQSQQIGHFCRLVVPHHRGNETRNNSMGSRALLSLPPSTPSLPSLYWSMTSHRVKKIIVRIALFLFVSPSPFSLFSLACESDLSARSGPSNVLWSIHYWIFVTGDLIPAAASRFRRRACFVYSYACAHAPVCGAAMSCARYFMSRCRLRKINRCLYLSFKTCSRSFFTVEYLELKRKKLKLNFVLNCYVFFYEVFRFCSMLL